MLLRILDAAQSQGKVTELHEVDVEESQQELARAAIADSAGSSAKPPPLLTHRVSAASLVLHLIVSIQRQRRQLSVTPHLLDRSWVKM